MRSIVMCACVGLLLLVSPASGYIVTTGDWGVTTQSGEGGATGGWGHSSATAHAEGTAEDTSYVIAEGWESTYTTS